MQRRQHLPDDAGDALNGAARSDGPVLVYDGACAFCSRTVQFVLRHDRRRIVRFASLQGQWVRRVPPLRLALRGVDSVVWMESEHSGFFLRSDAVLRLASYLGGVWRLAVAGALVPRRVRDAVYDVVARHRHRLRSPAEACWLPPPDERHRFLD